MDERKAKSVTQCVLLKLNTASMVYPETIGKGFPYQKNFKQI